MSAFVSALRAARGESLSAEQVDLLEQHWRLVLAWNKRTNLTAIVNDTDAAWLHYADSLSALGELLPGSVADLGSGAGYPGVPLAIVSPTRSFTLVEPRQKRASFLDVAISRLGLTNVRVQVGRSEEVPTRPFDNVVTRATFSDEGDLEACLAWLRPGGRLIALRANNVASNAVRIVTYKLRSDTHALHIWDKP